MTAALVKVITDLCSLLSLPFLFSFFFFLSLGRKTPGGALSHCLPEVKSLSVHSHSHLHPVRQTVLFVLRWLSECFSDKSKRMSWYVCVVYSALPLIVGTFFFVTGTLCLMGTFCRSSLSKRIFRSSEGLGLKLYIKKTSPLIIR